MRYEVWQYDGGEFVHTGQFAPKKADQARWDEFQPDQHHPIQTYHFREFLRDRGWIYLFDDQRRLWAALSTKGGECYLQWWLPEDGLPQYPWQLQYANGLMCNLVSHVAPVPAPVGV